MLVFCLQRALSRGAASASVRSTALVARGLCQGGGHGAKGFGASSLKRGLERNLVGLADRTARHGRRGFAAEASEEQEVKVRCRAVALCTPSPTRFAVCFWEGRNPRSSARPGNTLRPSASQQSTRRCADAESARAVAQVELDTMQAQLSKVERNIEALEAEEQGARGRGDEAEVSTLREEKRQLREKERQLREKERQLREKELKLLDLRAARGREGAWPGETASSGKRVRRVKVVGVVVSSTVGEGRGCNDTGCGGGGKLGIGRRDV
jgi:hypothetical protein